MIKIPKDDVDREPKRKMLHYLRDMQCDNREKATWNPRKDRSVRKVEDFVLKHGSFYTSKILVGVHFPAAEGEPIAFERGIPGWCYYHALDLVERDARLTYVEGYAFTPTGYYCWGLHPTPHAWVVNADNEAIDVTWDDPGVAYCGVPFRGEWLMDLVVKHGKGTFAHWTGVYHRFGTELLGDLGDHPETWKGTPGAVTNEHANSDRLFLGEFPFTSQLCALAEQGWHGKAAELLPLLLGMARRRGIAVPDGSETPRTPQMLVKKLKWLAPRLERAGITVENDRRHCWSIRRAGAPAR